LFHRSYNPAVLIYGTANLYNYTNGSAIWQERTSGLLRSTIRNFYSLENATNVLFEQACEPHNTCNNDQYSFKTYASRYLAKTAVLAPYTLPAIRTLLTTSAQAAAQACSSGADNATCGQKWYVGGFDGNAGIGQQMSALEAVQALLPILPPQAKMGPASANSTNSTGSGSGSVQDFVPRTAPSVTIAARDVTSTFVAEEPTGTPDVPPEEPTGTPDVPPGQPSAGSNGEDSGSGGGDGKGESAAVLQHRPDVGLAIGLLVIVAFIGA
jgi:mannan endo-1,6-alpha-mannosidase